MQEVNLGNLGAGLLAGHHHILNVVEMYRMAKSVQQTSFCCIGQ
jgi:hypothetical protein